MQWVTHSPEETHHLGICIGNRLEKGDVVIMLGDMGSGKSELTRGIARGLGIEGAIPSPTFTIMQLYDQGRLKLYHFDWYRLGSSDELYEMGMDEYLGGDGVAVVEWPTRALDALPEQYLCITASQGEYENDRVYKIEPVGGFRDFEVGDAFEHLGD